MSFVRLTWIVLVNILAIVVVFAVLNRVSGEFETFVISGLVLIYTSISSRVMAVGYGLDEVTTRLADQHASVLSHFDSAQAAQIYDAIKQARDESTKVAWAMLIKGGFNVVLTVMATFYAMLAWLGR